MVLLGYVLQVFEELIIVVVVGHVIFNIHSCLCLSYRWRCVSLPMVVFCLVVPPRKNENKNVRKFAAFYTLRIKPVVEGLWLERNWCPFSVEDRRTPLTNFTIVLFGPFLS
jgi:hypothetical protein